MRWHPAGSPFPEAASHTQPDEDQSRPRSPARGASRWTRVRQLEVALNRGRSVLLGRSGDWQIDANCEHGENQHSARHTAAELRTAIVNLASFSGDLSLTGHYGQ